MSQSAAGRRWMRWTVSRLFVLHAASRVARKSGGGGKPGLPSRIARIIARHDSEAGRRVPSRARKLSCRRGSGSPGGPAAYGTCAGDRKTQDVYVGAGFQRVGDDHGRHRKESEELGHMTLFELRLAPNRSRLSCGKEEISGE